MTRAKVISFYALTALAVSIISYACLETVVRLLKLPDPILIRDIERELSSPARGEGGLTAPKSVYGWDQPLITCTANSAHANSSSTARTVLFVGDSITHGYGVEVSQSYPILLCHALSAAGPVHVVNAAVDGFGVDQMIMKLTDVLPQHRPDRVVFAYIPHDLWRPARHVYFGATKPIMMLNRANGGQIIPAPDQTEFYERYADAERGYYLGLWSLRHVAANIHYYWPQAYSGYYRALFQEIRDRLIAQAHRYGTRVLVVRLASTWPGAALEMLDGIGTQVFAPSADPGIYRYYDSEDCVRKEASASGVNYAEEFKYHPGSRGQRIYASCLDGEI